MFLDNFNTINSFFSALLSAVSTPGNNFIDSYDMYIFGGCGVTFVVFGVVIAVLVVRKLKTDNHKADESSEGNARILLLYLFKLSKYTLWCYKEW